MTAGRGRGDEWGVVARPTPEFNLPMIQATEMRLDPLRLSWTIFAEARATRPPALGERVPGPNGSDPFAPQHADLLPKTLYRAGEVRVIPNRLPALQVEGSPAVVADGFYDKTDGTGAHEIVIETDAGDDFAALSLAQLEQIIDAWKARMLDLARDGRLRAFAVVKSVGLAAGATAVRPVSQVVAMALVPPALRGRLAVAREFFARKKRAIFEDILREEARVGSRMVYENSGFAAFCPYASRVPFELAIFPKRQVPDFHGITDAERAQLADVFRQVFGRLARALDEPPYQLALFTAPSRTARRDYWNTIDLDFRWHLEVLPRLAPSDAFDLATGCHVNTVRPERAAEFLRASEAVSP